MTADQSIQDRSLRLKQLSLEVVEWLYAQSVNDTEALLVLNLALATGGKAIPKESAVAKVLSDLMMADAGMA